MDQRAADALLNEALLDYLEPEERERLQQLIAARVEDLWKPQAGPQTEAYHSAADITGYGGAAGGGKTDLAIGLALTQHRKVGIFRQTGTELTAVVDRIEEILGSRSGFNGQNNIWRTTRVDNVPVQIEFGSFPNPGDEKKYQGRPHDLLIFDEAANMRESAVRFLLGWLRSADPEQYRCRSVFCFNPPTSVEGRWVIKFFAPWLQKNHPNPAQPGELRWFAMIDGAEIEVDGPAKFDHKGETITPMSRTFIPALVSDNKYLAGTGYEARLQGMPEPLRSQMLRGDFEAGMEDDEFQVIPTKWVELAMDRWEEPEVKPPMDSIGVDVAMKGRDKTIIMRRHGMWFDRPVVHPGVECVDGPTIASFILARLRDSAPIHIDLFGVGSQPYGHLMATHQQVLGVNVGDKTAGTTVDGSLRFFNKRTELWWRMREALDPTANTGIALPKDDALLADLCAPKWSLKAQGVIYVQSREEIVKELGRSPDFGSAACLALMDTMKRAKADELLGRGAEEYDPFKNL